MCMNSASSAPSICRGCVSSSSQSCERGRVGACSASARASISSMQASSNSPRALAARGGGASVHSVPPSTT
nr:MAG: hypothetical protein [Molluscum contagiosum virus]